MIIYEPRRHTDNTTLTRYLKHINYEYELYMDCTLLTRPWGTACSTHCCRVETDTCTKKKRKKKSMWPYPHPSQRPLQQYMLLSPIPTFYVLQCVIYAAVSMSKQAKANSPAESPQMHTESSPPCHTHTHSSASQRSEKARAPQTFTVSTVHRRTWPPTLNMEMLWKQNLNIYIRWLWKRGYALLFTPPLFSMDFL